MEGIEVPSLIEGGGDRFCSFFALARPLPAGDRRGTCGLFYVPAENEVAYRYNQGISSLFSVLVTVYLQLLEKGYGTRDFGEKHRGELAEANRNIANILNDLKRFLSDATWKQKINKLALEEVAVKKEAVSVNTPWDRKQELKVFYARPTEEGEGDLCVYYIDSGSYWEKAAEVRERFIRGELSEKELRAEVGRINREVRVELAESFAEAEEDEEVREYWKYIAWLGREALESDDRLCASVFDRLFFVEISFGVGVVEEERSGFFEPVISKLGYFERELSFEDVVERIALSFFSENAKIRRELKDEKKRKEILDSFLEELREIGAEEWLKKVYRKDSPFLKKLRARLYDLITSGKAKKVKRIKLVAEDSPRFVAVKTVQASRYVPFIICERSLRGLVDPFVDVLLDPAKRKREKYVNSEMMGEEVRVVIMEELIAGWRALRKKESFFKASDGEMLAVFLFQLTAFLKALSIFGRKRGIGYMPFFLLDKKEKGEEGEKDETLEVWECVRALLNHALPYPSQTVRKDTIKEILSYKGTSAHKNALLSAVKQDRVVTLRFDREFADELSSALLMIEHRTVEMVGGVRHYLYTVYRIVAKGNVLRIEQDEEKLFVFGSGSGGDVSRIEKLIKSHDHVVLVTQEYGSPVLRAGKHSGYYFPFLYRMTKTPVPPPKGGEENVALVIKGDQGFLTAIGWNPPDGDGEHADRYICYTIRAPAVAPPGFKEEPYFNTELSHFFIPAKYIVGAEPHVVERTLLYLIAWLSWGSESFRFTYAKPKFMPLRLPKLSLSRSDKNGQHHAYTFPASAVVMELAYLSRVHRDRVVE